MPGNAARAASAKSPVSPFAARCAPGAPPAVSMTARTKKPAPSLACAISTALLLTLIAAPVFAGSASATMNVSCSVIARAIMSVSSEPATVTVTEADVARGYMDVASPIVIQVRTNSRAGYLLQADRQASALGAVDLAFGDAAMTVSDTQSWISRPYVAGGEVLSMRARVHLDAGTQPGSYPLPIALSVRPL